MHQMNAVVSGRCRFALLSANGVTSFLSPAELEPPVIINEGHRNHLLRSANDSIYLLGTSIEETRTQLALAVERAESLDLLLFLLDKSLSLEVRTQAAKDLERRLVRDGLSQYLAEILFARPLPADAGISASIRISSDLPRVSGLLQQVANYQQWIGLVRQSFEQVNFKALDLESKRRDIESVCIARGVFRDLAMALPFVEFSTVFKRILGNCSELTQLVPDISKLGDAWLSNLPLEDRGKRAASVSYKQSVCVDQPTKYWISRCLGVVLLVFAAPVILLLTLCVRLTSRGPGLYAQTRTGHYGKEFRMYKIRTMYQDAESVLGPTWCKSGDSRITPIGRVLRLLHLDELPLLINVVQGEMAFVGPRPERPAFVEILSREIPNYRERLKVLPGITGLAQINLPPDETFDCVRKKLVLDSEYIRAASISLDVRILICTALKMLGIRHNHATRWLLLNREIHPTRAKGGQSEFQSRRSTSLTGDNRAPSVGRGNLEPENSDNNPYAPPTVNLPVETRKRK